MRIALVSTPFVPVPPRGYGGTELVVAELARALEAAGEEVAVFATGDSAAPRLGYAFGRAIWPPDPWAELVHCRRAAEFCAAGGFDVVHAHAPAMAAFARGLGCPLVLTVHHAADGAIERVYADAEGVTLVGISARQAELAGVRFQRVVHHGLDPTLYGPPGRGGDTAYFLGRLSHAKGPDLAIAAARRAGLRIELAGKVHPEDPSPPGWLEGSLLPALREPHVRASGVADLATKRRAFARARALLAPIRWEEPFGLVLVEAGLAGCPVVAFPRGAVPEIVEDGVTGFVVEDLAGMALALRWAARLDRRRIQARVRERFSADRMARGYLAAYAAAIGQRGGGVDERRPLTAAPEELFGYADPASQPEATGVDKLVLKRGNLFLVANRLGDVWPAGARDLGFFQSDTRHLSGWRLEVQGGPPLCLSSQVSPEYLAQVDFTVTSLHAGGLLGAEPVNFVHLRRDQLVDDLLLDRLTLRNFLDRPVDLWLELSWAADFADVFEVRGARRARRGAYHRPIVEGTRSVLRYDGLDGRRYVTEVAVLGATPAGGPARLARIGGGGARVELHLAPAERVEVAFAVAAGVERPAPGVRRGPDEDRPPSRGPRRGFAALARETLDAYAAWGRGCTRFTASSGAFEAALGQAVADLKALTVFHFGEPVVSAGIPWYTCPFGRDALLTGYAGLLSAPEVARDALRFLARLQGTRDDPGRDEEPGKIAHEIRFGEMAGAGEIPHTPYYGSADATPLFLVLLHEYLLWTGDEATVDALLPAAERALAWIDTAGERAGDGLVTYARRTPGGLRNQGWKDSHDGVPFADGTPAEPPIALVEVQGYAVDARRRMAWLLAHRGRLVESEQALSRAAALAAQIEARFWMEAKGTYAIALDRDGRQVDAVTSNPGHLLFSRVPSRERAERVAASLLGPGMWSGWGIRTLAAGQRAYNPLSYHDGTVWPHDNAIAAMGLATHGRTHDAATVTTGLWEAAQHFRLLRLPELFCGLSREEGQFPVHYPVACSPQAWSSAAWFLLVRACLGLFPDAPAGLLRVVEPVLPPWLDHLTLTGLRVGPARATIRFVRGPRGVASAEVLEVEGGPLRVRIEV